MPIAHIPPVGNRERAPCVENSARRTAKLSMISKTEIHVTEKQKSNRSQSICSASKQATNVGAISGWAWNLVARRHPQLQPVPIAVVGREEQHPLDIRQEGRIRAVRSGPDVLHQLRARGGPVRSPQLVTAGPVVGREE